MKTLKSKISTTLNIVSKRMFGNPAAIRNILKPSVVKLLNILTFGRGISVNIGGKGIFKLSPQFYFSNWENFGEGHNSGFSYCLEQAKDKRVVLDIGAHIGLYSMPLSRRISPNGKIYSFEPSSINRSYLKQHLELNSIDNVEVQFCLVGKENIDAVDFYEDLNQVNPMGGLILTNNIKNDAVAVSKKMVALDQFCEDKKIKPELIKVDVEGAEIDLLWGGVEMIKSSRPTIVLSFHPKHIEQMGQTLDSLTGYLQEVNYKCLTYDGKDNSDFSVNESILLPNEINFKG
jgi:FkbM family methyltransferase